ncbi:MULTISPECIES: DUF305 domain-containing protein [Burkholderiales]|jgi:uncharacterized protein (DUF305 family)|uniref:DUF305 domain-containing protein n=2 Tax=Betaproteobacteria TaxID=28216 RepID=UPI0009E661A6
MEQESGMSSGFVRAGFLGLLVAGSTLTQAADMHAHSMKAEGVVPPSFMASTAKPFDALMGDAMAVMDHDMRTAPMNGQPAHDFMTMMIPHHQGAIDMAKSILLNTQDPEVRNLAQGIITEQSNEIRLMQAWLARHASPAK